MSADDLELASRFLTTLATVANTGRRELLYPFLAPDVEWVTPRRTLAGMDEVQEQLMWLTEPVSFDLEEPTSVDEPTALLDKQEQTAAEIRAKLAQLQTTPTASLAQ